MREALDRLRYWDSRRDARESEVFQVGDRVCYKDEKVVGVVTEIIDGREGRKPLVGREGALVSFRDRRAVPVFLWALRPASEGDK